MARNVWPITTIINQGFPIIPTTLTPKNPKASLVSVHLWPHTLIYTCAYTNVHTHTAHTKKNHGPLLWIGQLGCIHCGHLVHFLDKSFLCTCWKTLLPTNFGFCFFTHFSCLSLLLCFPKFSSHFHYVEESILAIMTCLMYHVTQRQCLVSHLQKVFIFICFSVEIW